MAKVVMEPLASIYAEVKKYKAWIIAAAVIGVMLLAVGVEWKDIFLFPILFLAATFSTYYKRIVKVPPAFELVSLTTVVVGMTHGPWAGAIFGATAALAAEIVNSGIDAFIIGYVGARIVMGALAGFFPMADIVVAGMLLLLLFNILAQSLYLMQGDPEARAKTAIYVTLNLFINYFLFSLFGKPLPTLLK